MRNIFHSSLLLGAIACSGSTVEVGAESPNDGGAASPTSDGGSALPSEGGVTITGSKVEIHLRASTAAVPHTDTFSSQTPSKQAIGIRSLALLKSATDTAPLMVFDHGSDAVEAGLNDGDDTVVATVAAKGLAAGTFRFARVGVGHVRYRVAATMHSVGQVVPGTFDNFHVLSKGSTVDGKTWNKGHYSFTFEVGGQPIATQPGENGPLPEAPSGGAITLDTSGDVSAYVFPVTLPVDPDVASDVKMIFEVNTHENFRWEDESAAGYKAKVFDVTPTVFEPVKSFGANSFTLVADFSGTGL